MKYMELSLPPFCQWLGVIIMSNPKRNASGRVIQHPKLRVAVGTENCPSPECW